MYVYKIIVNVDGFNPIFKFDPFPDADVSGGGGGS
jgi:hypothetical protein